ncbi:stage V sporulation protein AB [Gottschalkia purinilytica]|uniref:Stage V sporulation protein AB n=1 Tax=Gottschalkia purinilytica TaxID=1503 RepID=A0A0L0WCS0_GOTPU|nr:stage V sporulation protein AB [Gottschalkia purinilytica]KNF09263.1 stage V sporulation protein AB [Gottschalkia purinilytica]
MIKAILIIIISISGGAVVGSAAAAFLTVLDVIPRLSQISKTQGYVKLYGLVISVSITLITFLTLTNFTLNISQIVKLLVIPMGFLFGMFVGLLASALAEVLNVIPVLVKKLKISDNHIKILLISTALGKMIGSLVEWIFLNGK